MPAPMDTPRPLHLALDEAVASLARAIELYHRSRVEPRLPPHELPDALAVAMRALAEASRLEFERRRTEPPRETREIAA